MKGKSTPPPLPEKPQDRNKRITKIRRAFNADLSRVETEMNTIYTPPEGDLEKAFRGVIQDLQRINRYLSHAYLDAKKPD